VPSDEIAFGSDRAPLRTRWAATPALVRLIAVACGILLVSALGLGLAAAHATPRQVTRTVADPTLHAARAVDASGCPVEVRCLVLPTARRQLVAAVSRALGATGAVVAGTQTVAAGGHVYAAEVVMMTRQARVRVASACVPGGAPVAAAASVQTFGHDDMSGNHRIDYRRATVVVPGTPGCSVVVTIDESIPAGELTARARTIAVYPDVQVGG
jgi:hypothetical protein